MIRGRKAGPWAVHRWRERLAGAALIAASAGVGGCANPLGPDESDYGYLVPRERFRQLDRLRVEDYERAGALRGDEPADVIERVVKERFDRSRFAGVETMELSIEQCRAAVLENNLELKVVLVDPSIAAERLRAEEAKFEAVFVPRMSYRETDDPTLQTTVPNTQDQLQLGAGVSVPMRTGGRASVDFTQTRLETSNPFVTLPTAYSSALSFSISQPLLRNAGRRASTYTIQIASYEEQISRARTKLEMIRLLAAADRSYWRLYAARRALEVTQQQYELAVAQLEQARRRVATGRSPEIEILRAQSGVAERLDAIIRAENEVKLQQRELKRVINLPGLDVESKTAITTATEPDPVAYAFEGAGLADAAVANRMEMLELELRLAADAATIRFNRNQALPLFTLDYTYRIAGLGPTFADSNSVLWQNNFESWSIGLTGEIPIGNEAASARVQQSLLTRLQRLSTAEARRLAIRQEVLDAEDRIEAGWQRILAARQAAIAAARTFEAEQRQFDVGARTSTDVLDAATRLAEAQLAEIRAIADYQIAMIDLAFATGTLLGASKVEWDPTDPAAAGVADPDPRVPTTEPARPLFGS